MSATATTFGVWMMHVQRWRVLYLGDVRLEAAVQSPRFHVFRNQPLSPEDVKGKALLGGPRCWCRILFASAIFFKKDNETGTDIQKQFSLEGFSALQAHTLQTQSGSASV